MKAHEKMKIIRKYRGLKQKDVAERMGTSVQNYAQYESGRRTPKYSTLEKLAKALDCTPLDLSEDGLLSEPPSFKELSGSYLWEYMSSLFLTLNTDGQKKVIDFIELVIKIPEYIDSSFSKFEPDEIMEYSKDMAEEKEGD